MAKQITLTQGKFTLVDDEDYDFLMQWKWHSHCGYAARTKFIKYEGGKEIKRKFFLHREVMNAPDDMEIDHINCDRLDNRKNNLRMCLRSQNSKNTKGPKIKKTSKYKGVSWDKRNDKWLANIRINSRSKNLGRHSSEKDAAVAYNLAAIEHHGKFARINEL